MDSDIGIQGIKFILSNMPGGKISILNVSINTKFEIHDFVNSFNEIIDKILIFSDIDGIFVKLFKKANYFDFHANDLKQVGKLNTKFLNICIENKINDLQSIVLNFWANDNFLKLNNCGQKSNLELIDSPYVRKLKKGTLIKPIELITLIFKN